MNIKSTQQISLQYTLCIPIPMMHSNIVPVRISTSNTVVIVIELLTELKQIHT